MKVEKVKDYEKHVRNEQNKNVKLLRSSAH